VFRIGFALIGYIAGGSLLPAAANVHTKMEKARVLFEKC